MTADAVLPLAVAVPFGVAAVLVAAARGPLRRTAGPLAMLTALGVAGLLAWAATADDPVLLHWFAGWRPRGDLVPGVPFVAGPVGGPLAATVAAVVGLTLAYSLTYFDDVGPAYWALNLTLLTGMVGFVLSGDVFDLFIFYELVGVSAYALTGYVVEHEGPLQGAINFAVSNTIGALLVLAGGAFLYVGTGTPNLAAAGAAIAGGEAGPAIVAAYALLTAGLFVKAAVVPFHFWHADAHAVAPAPVCAVFAAVMIQLGLFVFARLHWVVFAGLWSGHEDAIRAVLVVAGATTAVVAATMALLQSHLKRMLAFSSLAHVGVALLGVGMLSATGVAGAALYLLSHAGVKSALFLTVGVLVHRFGAVQQEKLHGRGRGLPGTAAVFVLGGLGLAGLPPSGMGVGKTLVEEAGAHHGLAAITIGVLVVAGAATGAAVLRAAGRIFLGWGEVAASDSTEDEEEQEQKETDQSEDLPGATGTRILLLLPAGILLVLGLAVGALPGLAAATHTAAEWFVRPELYRAGVLDGDATTLPAVPATWWTLKGLLTASGTVLLAVAVAAAGLRRPRPSTRRRGGDRLAPVATALRRLHSGHVGDYVAWLVLGLAAVSASLATALR